MSGETDRAVVLELIDYGIAGFLVKPLFRNDVVQRLSPILQAVARGESPVVSGSARFSGDKPVLVIADTDNNFIGFARSLLENRFDVHVASTGIEAHDMISKLRPAFAMIAPGLPMLGEVALSRVLRGAGNETPLVLIAGAAAIPDGTSAHFRSVIRRSFVPDVFLEDLRQAGVIPGHVESELSRLLQHELRAALISATQQSIGVLASRDTALSADDVVECDVEATIPILLTGDARSVNIAFFCSAAAAESLGSQILGETTSLDAGSLEAMAEVVGTIAGRFREALMQHAFACNVGFPKAQRRLMPVRPEAQLSLIFATAAKEVFAVDVNIAGE